MTDIKAKVQGLEANIQARDIQFFIEQTGTIYESLVIISKRASQIAVNLKQELHQKLDEFAIATDAIEEVHENKEQIEISKFYEKLPNPTLIAIDEYLNGELHYYYKSQNNEQY